MLKITNVNGAETTQDFSRLRETWRDYARLDETTRDLLSAGDEDVVVVVGVGDGARFTGAHHLSRGPADRLLSRDVPHHHAEENNNGEV